MSKQKSTDKKYSSHGMVNSGGTASIDLSFSGGEFSKVEKEKALANVLAGTTEFMLSKGYIRLMSASDVADEHGKSRQYWEKLIRDGKIPYQQTKAGRITTNLWVDGYLQAKENRETYIAALKRMTQKIIAIENNNKQNHHGSLECEICGNNSFDYNYNGGHHINGVCRAPGCTFRIDTQK